MLATNGADTTPPTGGSDAHVKELASDLKHLPTSSIADAAQLLNKSKWDLLDIHAESLIMEPLNGAYRIELFKRLTNVHSDFLVPWIVKHLLKKTEGVDTFDISVFDDDAEFDHLTWAAVNALVAGRLYNLLKDSDIGHLRAPVDAAYELVQGSSETDADAIRDIIRVRRAYKVDEIKELLTGGAALREGAL